MLNQIILKSNRRENVVLINIYKINKEYLDEFLSELDDKDYVNTSENKSFTFNSEFFEDIQLDYNLSFYSNEQVTNNTLSWNWVRTEFGLNPIIYLSKPKAILLISEIKKDIRDEKNILEENYYAISFGYAFHNISGYCDRLWAFNFAEHLKYKSVNLMNILAPNSVINKKINNYSNFNRVELNSGEALNQIIANIELDEEMEENTKNKIIISNSIKFEIKEPKLEYILNLIDYVNYHNTKEIKSKIPYFKECADKIKKQELTKNLVDKIFEDISSNQKSISICEFFIIDNNIKFLSDFTDFHLIYKNFDAHINDLNLNEIYQFIDSNLSKEEDILEIQIHFKEIDSDLIIKKKFKNLIIYDDTDEPFIFDEGKWLTYNDVYMEDLKNSLDDIDVIYDEKFDFKKKDYEKFIKNKAKESNEEIKSIKKKFYKEFAFNTMREKDGYICNDTKKDSVNGHIIEVADLFKLDEKAMFSVKIGNTSSDLSYVVDQSTISIRTLDNGEIKEIQNEKIKNISKKDIENVYLWIILKRKRKLPLKKDGKVDLNKLNMLILKNKIDYWKKEVIMTRRNPKIRINYIDF